MGEREKKQKDDHQCDGDLVHVNHIPFRNLLEHCTDDVHGIDLRVTRIHLRHIRTLFFFSHRHRTMQLVLYNNSPER